MKAAKEIEKEVLLLDGICKMCNNPTWELIIDNDIDDEGEPYLICYGYCPLCLGVTKFYEISPEEKEATLDKIKEDWTIGTNLNIGQYVLEKITPTKLVGVHCYWCGEVIEEGTFKAINHPIWFCEKCTTTNDGDEDY